MYVLSTINRRVINESTLLTWVYNCINISLCISISLERNHGQFENGFIDRKNGFIDDFRYYVMLLIYPNLVVVV